MALLPKEIADILYQEGKMGESWYRQHYYTFDENWVYYSQKGKERTRALLQKRAQDQQRKAEEKELEKAIEKAIDNSVKPALDKALSKVFHK